MKKFAVPILLLIGCSIFFSFNLGDLSLLKGDENYYFSSARRMIRDGDWVTPRYHHHIRFEKPPLYYWIVATFFKLFGVSWVTARMTSVLFGALTALLTYLLGLRLLPRRAANLSPVILSTSFLFFLYTRVAVIDMVFLFFVTLSIFMFLEGDKKGKNAYIILASIPLGLSVLAKGPLGIVVFALIAISYTLSTKKYRLLSIKNVAPGMLILLLITLPWPIMMYKLHGHEYLKHLWEIEAVDKVVGSLSKIENISNLPLFVIKYILYYVPVVLFSFVPWSLLLPFSLNINVPGIKREDRAFILSWFWCIFIFFTIVSFKHTHYMLLLSPPLAMIVASFFERKKRWISPERLPIILTVATIVIFILCIGVIFPKFNDGTLKTFSLRLASEMKEQDEEIGVASKGFNLKKIGIYLNNLVSTPYELGGDDLAQYRRINKNYAVPFFESADRVYCLITKSDYENSIPERVRNNLFVLENTMMWKKFNFKKYLPLILKRDWTNLKEEAYLISNRR